MSLGAISASERHCNALQIASLLELNLHRESRGVARCEVRRQCSWDPGRRDALHPVPPLKRLFEKVRLNFMGPSKFAEGKDSQVFVLIDNCTYFVQLVPIGGWCLIPWSGRWSAVLLRTFRRSCDNEHNLFQIVASRRLLQVKPRQTN